MDLSKDNSNFLCHYQRLVFNGALESGSPAEQADVVRGILTQLRVAALTERVKDGGVQYLSQAYQEKYADIVDSFDEQTGLNNYAEGALALCSGYKNESQNWKSSLSLDRLKSLPCVQKAMKASQEEADRLLPPNKRNDLLPAVSTLKSTETLSRPNNNPSVMPGILRTKVDQPDYVTNKSEAVSSAWPRPSSVEERGPRKVTPPTSTCMSNHPADRRPEQTSLFSSRGGRTAPFSQVGGHASSGGLDGRQDPREIPGQKRPYRDVDEESPDENRNGGPSAFRTARQQLSIENQKKYGGQQARGPVGPAAYGTGKKSLGTRRGPSNRFVPPVMNREDEDGMSNQAANTITRAVLKTGGGSSGGCSNNQEAPEDERLKGIEPKMVELIMNEIMDNGPKMSWDDIAGLDFAKKTIKEIVVWPMLRPDIFTGLRGPPKGLLLFGPPGTGKTLIGKCIASQSSSTFFCISASSLTSKWVGEGEKMVRALFAVARCNQPAVVFIDEIDSLLTQRTDGENEASRRIKTEFLVQLDGASTSSEDKILIIGATNRPQEIDEAARRRFVKRLYIPLPECSARQQIVVNLLKQQTFQLTPDELDCICQKTDGFSGADMATLCREAALGPIRDMSFGDIENISADQVRPITYRDFEDALLNVKPSVSTKDLDAYIEWNQTFGSGSR